MKAKRILALLLALCLIVTAFAACGNSEDGSSATSGGGTSEATSGGDGDDAEPTDVSTGPDDTSELYEFTVYYNYTGWSKVWGRGRHLPVNTRSSVHRHRLDRSRLRPHGQAEPDGLLQRSA